MSARLTGLAAAAASLAFTATTVTAPANEPFAFLAPVVTVDAPQRARLRAGDTLVSVLPGHDGHVAVSALIRVDADPQRLTEWARQVDLQQGRYVESIGRFSTPPRVADLAGLRVDDTDLEDIRNCRPGDCNVKLAAQEMADLRAVPRPDLQAAFRQLLVRRAAEYLRAGDCAMPPYADASEPVAPAAVFAALLQRMEILPRRFPRLVDYIEGFPGSVNPQVTDSFLYWSKETLGMKPIIGLTHVTIARVDADGLPEVVVVAKQVFANHYKNGAVTLTAIAGRGEDRYLVYLQRAHVDVLKGVWGSVVRRMLERRVKKEAPGVLIGLRDRLQSPQLTTAGAPVPDGR